MEDFRLYWEGKKTVYEACKNLTTKGFIAAELFESRVREIEEAVKDWHKVADQRSAEIIRLEAERDRLKERVEWFEKSGGVAVHAEVFKLRARHAALVEKYNELLYSVGNKYPDESRHETALRYIRNAEKPTDNVAHQAALAEVK
jgi:hypothetical protein